MANEVVGAEHTDADDVGVHKGTCSGIIAQILIRVATGNVEIVPPKFQNYGDSETTAIRRHEVAASRRVDIPMRNDLSAVDQNVSENFGPLSVFWNGPQVYNPVVTSDRQQRTVR